MAAFLEHQAFEGVVVLSASRSKRLVSANGAFISRALLPFDVTRQSERYELRLSPPHSPGFQVDDPSLAVGIRALSRMTLSYMIDAPRLSP